MPVPIERENLPIMSFLAIPPEPRAQRVRGWSYLALALGLMALSPFIPMDPTGQIFFFLFIGLILVRSLSHFWRAWRVARPLPPGLRHEPK
jgi:hypothetical protein